MADTYDFSQHTREELENALIRLTFERHHQPPAWRVMRGFRRAAIVFGSVPIIGGLVQAGVYQYNGWLATERGLVFAAFGWLAAAFVIAGLIYGLGWILAGFFRDTND